MPQEKLTKTLMQLQGDANIITLRSISLSKSLGELIELLASSEGLDGFEFGDKFAAFSISLTLFADSLESFEKHAAGFGESNNE